MKAPGDFFPRIPCPPRRPGRIALSAFLAAGLVLIVWSVLEQRACGDELTGDVVALSLAGSMDLASTHYALSQCGGRCREGNPLMQNAGGRIVLKAAGVAATSWACDRLRKKGHRNAAKVLRWGVAAAWSGVAIHNMRTANKLRGMR